MTTGNESSRPELLYVGDPLCSWCYGFAPSLERLRFRYPNAFRYVHVVGGLRTGPAASPLDEGLREYLSRAWREVERRSGQPFDHEFLGRASFVYDTEPACRGVVAARKLGMDAAFEYNEALQRAFYARGLDPTAPDTFLAAAREVGFEEEAFQELLESEEVATETRADFELARRLGVMGFPTTLVRDGARPRLVAGGYVSPGELLDRVAPFVK